MKRIRYLRVACVMLLAGQLLGLVVLPAGASGSASKAVQPANSTFVHANMYVTLGTLQPLFQARITQQVPGAVANAIDNMVGKLPHKDQGWATQMASTLIQPTATLISLTTQRAGLAASLRLSLYPGDPQAITASALITFSVINSSTIAVNARPLNGSPALLSGPVTTFHASIGQLSSIATTPTCGAATLALGLQFPLAPGQGQANAPLAAARALASTHIPAQQGATDVSRAPASNSYLELPASALSAVGNSIGELPINSALTAKNFSIGVQGKTLLITADIYTSLLGKIGMAVTTVAPAAAQGGLSVRVLNTNLTILHIFTFPYNSYNQQIQQSLNARLNGALAGKFSVAQAAVGPSAYLPCASHDSLVLSGTTNLAQ